jgi:hypothetical protein
MLGNWQIGVRDWPPVLMPHAKSWPSVVSA